MIGFCTTKNPLYVSYYAMSRCTETNGCGCSYPEENVIQTRSTMTWNLSYVLDPVIKIDFSYIVGMSLRHRNFSPLENTAKQRTGYSMGFWFQRR